LARSTGWNDAMGCPTTLQTYLFSKSMCFKYPSDSVGARKHNNMGCYSKYPDLLMFLKILSSSWSSTSVEFFFFLNIWYTSPHLRTSSPLSRNQRYHCTWPQECLVHLQSVSHFQRPRWQVLYWSFSSSETCLNLQGKDEISVKKNITDT
jgi:hypothetical protein